LFGPQQEPNGLIIQVCPTSGPQSPSVDTVRFGRKTGPLGCGLKGCVVGRMTIVTAVADAEGCCVLVIEDADVLSATYVEVDILEDN
jgi:hypothetical protein